MKFQGPRIQQGAHGLGPGQRSLLISQGSGEVAPRLGASLGMWAEQLRVRAETALSDKDTSKDTPWALAS